VKTTRMNMAAKLQKRIHSMILMPNARQMIAKDGGGRRGNQKKVSNRITIVG